MSSRERISPAGDSEAALHPGEGLSGGLSAAIVFGEFQLLPRARVLLRSGEQVAIGSRALDILITLVHRSGDTVPNAELLRLVWPNVIVEENTLRVHISALRKALSDPPKQSRYISNRNGRGYAFIGTCAPDGSGTDAASAGESAISGLPVQLTSLIGRSETVLALAGELAARRLVTITGPAGVGKTSVALDVAHRLAKSFCGQAVFIDLSALAEPALVPSALASALGLSVSSSDPSGAILRFLAERRMLLVLDTCEHVIEKAAGIAQLVLEGTEGVHILATSREPLRARGEWVYRLSGLDYPGPLEAITAADAETYAAVGLFVERARANGSGFMLSDREAPAVSELCRQLDGLPLAIELAAGRVEQFGASGLLQRLEDRFGALGEGPRTAIPRHKTLRAALDWSHDLLSEVERRTFRRLGVFSHTFSIQAVRAVAGDPGTDEAAVIDVMTQLVAKSLVTVARCGSEPLYRLLDTSKAYARGKLSAVGETDDINRRHALFCADFLAGDRAGFDGIDDIRLALDWAFSAIGDAKLGRAIVVAASPVWFESSRIDECLRQVDRALGTLSPLDHHSREAMQLYAGRGGALMHVNGGGEEMSAVWQRVLDIAERCEDTEYRLRALWGLWVDRRNRGQYRSAFLLAEKYSAICDRLGPSAYDQIRNRMLGVSLFYAGRFAEARICLEKSLDHPDDAPSPHGIGSYQFDQKTAACCFLAQILWLQGHPDEAAALAAQNVERALELNHAGSLLYALTEAACPIALRSGQLDGAERYVELVLQRAADRGLEVWHALGLCFEGMLKMRRGEMEAGLSLFTAAIADLRRNRFGPLLTPALGELALTLANLGDLDEAASLADEIVAKAEANDEHWYKAELLRIEGEICRARGLEQDVETVFFQAIDLARGQGARALELRAATSLARWYCDQGRDLEAEAVLAPILKGFAEAGASSDIRTATDLLAAVRLHIHVYRDARQSLH